MRRERLTIAAALLLLFLGQFFTLLGGSAVIPAAALPDDEPSGEPPSEPPLLESGGEPTVSADTTLSSDTPSAPDGADEDVLNGAPNPGIYLSADEQQRYIDLAVRFVRLISTYTPENAEQNFTEASALLAEPYRETFQKEWVETELTAIRTFGRRQQCRLHQAELFSEGTETLHVLVTGKRTKAIPDFSFPPCEVAYEVLFPLPPKRLATPEAAALPEDNEQQPLEILSFEARNVDTTGCNSQPGIPHRLPPPEAAPTKGAKRPDSPWKSILAEVAQLKSSRRKAAPAPEEGSGQEK